LADPLTRLRGHVYFSDVFGDGDPKRVLVVSWNAVNELMRQPVVALISSVDRDRQLDTYVQIEPDEGGVYKTSFILCHALFTVDEEHIDAQSLGEIEPWTLLQVEDKLATALDFHSN
jgi:mRNA-degrading endonuclease toxin of MazEF toxin-antitoxin module